MSPQWVCLDKEAGSSSTTSMDSSVGESSMLTSRRRDDDEVKEKMKSAVRCLLECMGEDVEREGLYDTPKRVTEAFLYFTKGNHESVEDLIGNALFTSRSDGMVVVRDIEFSSLCEHHLLPFNGRVHIAFLPDGKVLGLSKYARVVEMFARRLQLQEQLTHDVACSLYKYAKPKGVAVVIEASHMCMVMRGVQKPSSRTITSCFLGCLENDNHARQELMCLLGK